MKSKPLSLTMVLLFCSALFVFPQTAGAQARFRVTFTGFVVNHETVDSVLSMDGAGDEVFAVVNFAELWSTNNIFGALRRKQSLVYGDVRGRTQPFNPTQILPALDHPGNFSTVFAGTASPSGGLKANDKYPPPSGPVLRPTATPEAQSRLIPMIIWEGELRRGGAHPNAIIMMPTIWESDNVPDVLNIWHRQADDFIRRFAAHSAGIFSPTFRRPLVLQVDPVLSTVPQRNDFDRPIGMDGDAFNPSAASPAPATFIPAIMLLTFDSAQAAADSTAQGRGMIEITYRDGQSYGPGSYTIFLRVERLP